jgi:hypothetical protein
MLGIVDCEDCFGTMPLEAVKNLMFSDEEYDLDFVLNSMTPKYDGTEHEDFNNCTYVETQKLVFRIHKETNKRQGILVDMLRDRCKLTVKKEDIYEKEGQEKHKKNDFLHEFVEYVTGTNYIRRLDFKIKVEFNVTELRDPESLPAVHSCVKTIKFPGTAYNGSREWMEKKLIESMEDAKICVFNMN